MTQVAGMDEVDAVEHKREQRVLSAVRTFHVVMVGRDAFDHHPERFIFTRHIDDIWVAGNGFSVVVVEMVMRNEQDSRFELGLFQTDVCKRINRDNG